MMEDVHSRIQPGEHEEKPRVFTSEGFSGFIPNGEESGFEKLEEARQAKQNNFFSIIQMLLKMMD